METNDLGNLSKQVSELAARVARIEDALKRSNISLAADTAAAPPAMPAPSAAPTTAATTAPKSTLAPWLATSGTTASGSLPPAAASGASAPPPIPSFGQKEKSLTDEQKQSLENKIGSQWFNRIGILAILIAAAWFLKMAFDNHWIGPLGRVLIGLITGTGLIAWSERFRTRGLVVFSYSLKAIGSGILYLSLWAAFSVFGLISSEFAFLAMVIITAFNGVMAWKQDAELLALYAIAGALSTPLLVSTGGNHEVVLFTYLLLLNFAVLILVILKPWSRLLFAAFTGTVTFFIAWMVEYYSAPQATRTAWFAGAFFLIFSLAPRLVRLGQGKKRPYTAWDTLVLVGQPLITAALGFLIFDGIIHDWDMAWFEPFLAVVFAAFYLLLLKLPARGTIQTSPAVLSSLHLTIVVVFLTIAIPMKAQGHWLTIGWLVEGAALLWLAERNRMLLLRVLSLLCLILGLIALFVDTSVVSTRPFLNARFGSYLVAIAVFAFVAWLMRKKLTTDVGSDANQGDSSISNWPIIGIFSALLVNLLILVAVGWEIHSYWWFLKWSGDDRVLIQQHMYAQFTYSAFFMLYGALLLTLGFRFRQPFLRWQGLILIAITIAKVFLFDMHELSQVYRVLSFLGLGVLLMAVSFVYQKDLLKLRNKAGE
jgi:uncharacterized membrane protein